MKLYNSLIYNKIKNKFLDLKISTKITLFYFILVVFTLILSVFLYQRMNSKIMSDRVRELSIQNLYSVNLNINSIIENINNYSRMIVAADDVREVLIKKRSARVATIEKMNLFLKNLINENPSISSVYIFDKNGNKHATDKTSEMWLGINDIKQAPWYTKVHNMNGAYILSLNAGDIFFNTPENNFVSMIRLIRDIDTMETLGILIINIQDSAFANLLFEMSEKPDSEIALLDEKNHVIVSNKIISKFDVNEVMQEAGNDEYFSKVVKIDKKEYLESYINLSRYDWKFISLVPLDEMKGEWESFNLITFFIISINGIILFIGSILISRTITNPIKKLIKSMRGIEKREFKIVDIKTGNDEIGKLKEDYNIMILEIQKLIQQIVEEQRIKRKAELNVLQAQVKPHFLYNTLDAMGYLALSGKSEELYESIEALGSYYRSSLSKGQEVITIKEEIEIAKSYLILQKLRYGEIFDVVYDIDEKTYKYKIPKLVLQPLIENSIYHGIKPKGEVGLIKICVRAENEQIILSVEDDGVGMSEEELESIKSDNIDSNSASFGLKGTIKRLQLFYGITDIYNIESKKRYGTKIEIIIPMLRGADNE